MNNNNIIYTSPQILASLPKDTPVLLAFSGGADSSALFHILINDASKNGFELHVAHFHHGIRGEEADRDAEFCQSVAEKFGVAFHLGKADIPSLAKESGNSIEAEAREQRYAFFQNVMKEHNIPILVTAHHAEDQAESVLLHVLRGSGIKGIIGMQECRNFGNSFYLVRPILKTQKKDILTLCEQNNIDFVTDSTNSDNHYTRNALRNEIIPRLYEIQPNLCAVLDRLSQSAAEADCFISTSAEEFIEKECTNNIPVDKFNKLFDAQKAKILSIIFEKSFSSTLERVHVDAIIELCAKAIPHSSTSLPKGLRAKIDYDSLIFEVDRKEDTEESDFYIPFCEGEHTISRSIVLKIEKNPDTPVNENAAFVDIACELIDHKAHFRNRREGDVIMSGKMNKKAKKLISEKKIPLDIRKKLPLLVSFDEILWIPLVATSDKVKNQHSKSGDFYRITITFENN